VVLNAENVEIHLFQNVLSAHVAQTKKVCENFFVEKLVTLTVCWSLSTLVI